MVCLICAGGVYIFEWRGGDDFHHREHIRHNLNPSQFNLISMDVGSGSVNCAYLVSFMASYGRSAYVIASCRING
jgi:hypothetical protein